MGEWLSEDQTAEDWTSRAQEKKASEWMSHQKDRKSVRILSTSHSFPEKDSLCSVLQPGIWSTFYKSDPRIAFGKYSPMEKELLRLGGIHTRAARRFLASKQEEEQKMLRELQLQSPNYKQALDCKKWPPTSCTASGPLEKVWTAKVIVPSEDFEIPQREKMNIRKHIERMQLARALGNGQLLPYVERLRSSVFLSGAGLSPLARDKAKRKGDKHDSYYQDNVKQKEQKTAEGKATEIKMNVIFKSEEPKKCIACHRNDRQPFLNVKKQERSITGRTNRNLFHIAEFPGDLMLMTQDFLSRGIHPQNVTRTCLL